MRLDLEHGGQDRAEPALHRGRDFALFQCEGGIGFGRIDNGRFCHRAEIGVLLFKSTFGGDCGEARAALDTVGGCLGIGHGGENDLLDMSPLRRGETRNLFLVSALDVVVGDFHPLRKLRRRNRDHIDLAVFRSAEHDFAFVEIFAELFVGRLRDDTRLFGAEHDIIDAAQFVLELVDGVEPRFGRRQIAGHAVDDLPAQCSLPLLGDKPLLGHPHIVQDLLELVAVELAVDRLQIGIGRDVARDFRIGDAEPDLAGPLIHCRLRNHFTENLPVEPECRRFLRRNRLAEIVAHLIEPIAIDLLEFGDADLGIANLGKRRAAEARENVVDAPKAEHACQQKHHCGHNDAAEPVFGGFSDTSKHVSYAGMLRT